MLLFKPYHVVPILNGSKVATRRVWKRRRVCEQSFQKAKLKMMSKEFFALLYVHEVFQQPLGEMTEFDAQEEGGYTLAQFKTIWEEINGPWDDSLVVWVVKFELEKEIRRET